MPVRIVRSEHPQLSAAQLNASEPRWGGDHQEVELLRKGEGYGVVATKLIEDQKTVTHWRGSRVPHEDVGDGLPRMRLNTREDLVSDGGVARFVRHVEDPDLANVVFRCKGPNIVLVTRKSVLKGQELRAHLGPNWAPGRTAHPRGWIQNRVSKPEGSETEADTPPPALAPSLPAAKRRRLEAKVECCRLEQKMQQTMLNSVDRTGLEEGALDELRELHQQVMDVLSKLL